MMYESNRESVKSEYILMSTKSLWLCVEICPSCGRCCWSESLVCIVCNKSDSFPVGIGLCQGCPLPLILFIFFMERISRHRHVVGGFCLGGLRISSLVFADDAVLFSSSSGGLQLTVECFTAECEAADMSIGTSKAEVRNGWSAHSGTSCCSRWGGFSRVTGGEWEIDRWIRTASAVMGMLHQSVAVKRESEAVPTPTSAHKMANTSSRNEPPPKGGWPLP